MTELEFSRETFGALPDGREVHRYAFGSQRGVSVQMLTYGATLQTLQAPDRHGRRENVILGLADLDDYRTKSAYFGATVGRYANRIAGGRFSLEGRTHQLPTNDEDNSLHGGGDGFDRQVWAAEQVTEEDRVGVRFSYVSANGEMGYPGELTTRVTYTVNTADELAVEYEATSTAPTVVNLTNHVYFNLAGEGSGTVYDQLLWLDADYYVPTDPASIPLGPLQPVADTAFDFREARRIGEHIRDGEEQLVHGQGYDHNWVLAGTRPPEGTATAAAAKALPLAAWARDPGSGRTLECWTTEPGVQFYSGNKLDGRVVGIGGSTYRQGDGFTLETQHYPDSPNQPEFPSTVLRPDETFTSATVYRFSC